MKYGNYFSEQNLTPQEKRKKCLFRMILAVGISLVACVLGNFYQLLQLTIPWLILDTYLYVKFTFKIHKVKFTEWVSLSIQLKDPKEAWEHLAFDEELSSEDKMLTDMFYDDDDESEY